MEREKGPIEILCKEIDFRFDRRMEDRAILVAFVGVLVDEIEELHDLRQRIASIVTGETAPPESDFDAALKATRSMLAAADAPQAITLAGEVHDLTHQPDDGPCDHFVDMLSSCASAIRFGLETPCRSRHAASAADHVWKHVYGVSRFDGFTSNWRNDWARAQLQAAILALTPRQAA